MAVIQMEDIALQLDACLYATLKWKITSSHQQKLTILWLSAATAVDHLIRQKRIALDFAMTNSDQVKSRKIVWFYLLS